MSAPPVILIVDDDHDTLDLLELFLYKSYDIATAMNGFEALAKIESLHPVLIMTDIKMPVMDGIRFLSNLRKHASGRTIPVIAVTSFTKDHSVKSLSALGFKGVIAKPPDGPTVMDTVARILQPQPAAGHGKERRTA